MLKNTDFIGSTDSNPFNFRHFDLTNFVMYVNGKQVPNNGLTLDPSRAKASVMAYRQLFEASGIHHANEGLQVTHDMFISGYFILPFDLTPDRSACDKHTSHPENGPIRIELQFAKELPEATTCLLYCEYDGSVRIDYSRTVATDFF